MALPQSAIEKISRAPVATQGAYQSLLLLSGTLLAIALFVWAGLTFGYMPYLEKQSADIEREIADFAQSIPKDEQVRIAQFYSQLANLKTLLADHITPSTAFALLERDTHPLLSYQKASLNVLTGELSLSGTASDLSGVAEQVALFEQEPQVVRVNFSNSSLTGVRAWQFALSVFIDPAVLKGLSSLPQ